jgi:hypothetical protein
MNETFKIRKIEHKTHKDFGSDSFIAPKRMIVNGRIRNAGDKVLHWGYYGKKNNGLDHRSRRELRNADERLLSKNGEL